MSENSGQRFQVRDPQGNVYGPADIGMLRDWVGQGRIVAGMHIADEADGQWVEVSAHPGLADLFAGPQPARAVMPSGGGGQVSPVTPVGQGGSEAPLSYAADGARQNVLGVISLITGIVSILGVFGCFCFCLGGIDILVAITAIILGAIGLHQIKNNPERYTGRGLALTGLILGIAALSLQIILTIIFFAMQLHR